MIATMSFVFQCDVAHAQKGKGKGIGKNNATQFGTDHRSQLKSKPGGGTKEKWVMGKPDSGSPATPLATQSGEVENSQVEKQSIVEKRKLEHRQQVAEHLRQIAERNGNQNLLDTAERHDEKASQHYEQRMSRINEVPDTGDPTIPEPELDAPIPSESPSIESPATGQNPGIEPIPEASNEILDREIS